jgi:hypothetical protein
VDPLPALREMRKLDRPDATRLLLVQPALPERVASTTALASKQQGFARAAPTGFASAIAPA